MKIRGEDNIGNGPELQRDLDREIFKHIINLYPMVTSFKYTAGRL